MMNDDEYDDYEPDDEGDLDDPYTFPCPECGAEIFDDAEQCPECGFYVIAAERDFGPIWRATAIVTIIALLLALGGYALLR